MAHSHGGNALLYAMREGEFAARLAGAVFLGTPFLRITLRDIASFSRTFTKVLSWLILFPGILPGVVMPLTTLAMNHLGPWGFGLQFIIGNALIVWGYYRYRERLQEWGEASLCRWLQARQSRMHDWIAQPEPPCPTYLASVRRDEPGIWLAFLDRLAEGPWMAVGLASRTVGVVFFVEMVLCMTALFVDGGLVDVGIWFPVSVSVVLGCAAIVVVGPVVAVFFSAGVRGTMVGFGWERFVDSCTLRIKPARYPSWSDRTARMAEHRGGGMGQWRHSVFYKDKVAIEDVAWWINGEETDAPAGAGERRSSARVGGASRGRRWLVPVVSGTLAFALSSALLVRNVRQTLVPKVDLDAGVASIADARTLVAEINAELAGNEVLDLGATVAYGQSCVVEGRMRLTKFETSMSVELDSIADERLGIEGVEQCRAEQYRRISQHVWYWNGAKGKEIRFRKRLRNCVPSRLSALRLRVWSEQEWGARLEGRLHLKCEGAQGA